MIKHIDTTRLKWLLTFFVCTIICFIPYSENFTSQIKLFFIITIFAVFMLAFELISVLAVSLFIPFAYLVFNLGTPAQIFSPWTQSTAWMIMASVILGVILDESGIIKRIAYFFFAKLGGSFNAILACIMFFGIILAYMSPGNGALFIIFAYSISKALNIAPKSNAAIALFFICYIAGAALSVMLSYDGMFDTALNTIRNSAASGFAPLQTFTFEVSYLDYIYHNVIFLPCAILLLIITILFFKPEIEYTNKFNKKYFAEEYKQLGKLEKKEISGAIVLFLIFILLLTQRWHGLGIYLCLMVPVIISFFPFSGLETEKIIKNINFTMIFFVCGTMSVGVVGNNTGSAALIGQFLTPLLGSGPFMNCGMAYILGYIINLILTPMAGIAMISGPVAEVISSAGIYPVPVMYALINGLNNVLLPYEGALYVFLYAFGYMSMKQFIKIFTIRSVIVFIWILIVAVPYWNLIGLFNGFVPFPF